MWENGKGRYILVLRLAYMETARVPVPEIQLAMFLLERPTLSYTMISALDPRPGLSSEAYLAESACEGEQQSVISGLEVLFDRDAVCDELVLGPDDPSVGMLPTHNHEYR